MTSKQKLWLITAIITLIGLTAISPLFSQMDAGGNHTLAVRNGTLWAWGRNNFSQVGNGGTANANAPARIGTATNWTSVSSGGGSDSWVYVGHSVGLRADGTLWAWGNNRLGATGLGTATGTTTVPTQIGTANDWASISAGGVHNLALKRDGSLWSWGENGNGRTGLGVSGETGTLTPTRIGTASDWAFISAGDSHSMAIKRDGTLWAWGANTRGKLGDGTTTQRTSPVQIGTDRNWASVSAGSNHTLAVKTDGTLWAWGGNTNGQLGNGQDGTGIESTRPIQIGTDRDWASVSAGGNMSGSFSMAIKRNGSLWGWGINLSGRTGLGTTAGNTTTPTRVGTATNWESVSAGSTYAVGTRTDGTLWVWGFNQYGQLGDGSTATRNAPVQINIAAAAAATPAAPAQAATATLSGVYELQGHRTVWTLTFTGNNFSMFIADNNTTVQGTFTVSGSTVTLNSSSFGTTPTRTMTITSPTTLRDWDGDNWASRGAASTPAPATTTLSGVYTLDIQRAWTFTFTGNNFSMFVADANRTIQGTYTISGNTVTLNSSGFGNAPTRTMTIISPTTLRDWDGDNWTRR